MPVSENRSIAIYSRKSRFTGKGESIENQIELCKNYIKTHFDGISDENILIYEDEGFSGGTLERPQFKKMFEDAKNKRLSAVVCYRLDRISRNISDFAKLITEFEELKVSFISIKEQFDTTSPMGKAMMYIASVFSQLERETIAERIRDNMRELAKTGRWLGGTTPTGYRSEPVEKVSVDGKIRKAYKLILIPDEIETIKLIFDKYLEYGTLAKTEEYLINNGIKTKNKKYFSRFTIKQILKNPVYIKADQDSYLYFSNKGAYIYSEKASFDGVSGIMAYNKTLQKKGKANKTRNFSEWIIAVGKHEGIISGKDYTSVMDRLEKNKIQSLPCEHSK